MMIAIRNEIPVPSFILASLISAYPDDVFSRSVEILLKDEELCAFNHGDAGKSFLEVRARLSDILGAQDLDRLRSEYIDLFDRGQQVNSLYETEYGRERALVKGNELADIAGFYRAFGFETGGDGVQPEMIDHVSVELEFYALMMMKYDALMDAGDFAGAEIVLDGRKKFLKSHLGRFVGAIGDRPGVKESSFYSSVFQYCQNLVSAECFKLGVEVEPEQWIGSSSGSEAMACGGSAGGCVQ